MIVVEDLTKRFPGRSEPAIEAVDLEVRDGELLGLVGLNGAGKTTTIRIAAGVTRPTRGRVTIDGIDLAHEKRMASQRVGWVPEQFLFDPDARALSLLEYYAGFHGLTGSSARSLCRELLARVGLAEVETGRIRTFSQGMKRRFSLASAMVSDPPNLLLDEIMSGLDPEGMAFVRGWISEIRRQGRAVLLSSHLLAELQTLADRVAFIHQGRILRTVDRSQLTAAGGAVLHISIRNLDDAALQYLTEVGTPRVEGSTVVLTNPRVEPESINSELVKRGYQVLELRVEPTSLETYFLKLIEATS